jgi:hypothetical protein
MEKMKACCWCDVREILGVDACGSCNSFQVVESKRSNFVCGEKLW